MRRTSAKVLMWVGVGLLIGWLVGGGVVWAEEGGAGGGDAGRPQRPAMLMVDTFDGGIQNQLGGYYNSFESAPSTAATLFVSRVRRGEGGRSLRVRANRHEGGFCGVWLQFFNFRERDHGYLDATGYAYLSFWVKGEKGGEDFAVKLADKRWIEKEDSVYVGHIDQMLPGGVTQEWQEVLVPLNKVAGMLDLKNLGGVTLDFTTEGQYTLYVDDVGFKTSRDVVTPLSPKDDAGDAMVAKKFPKSMWVWSTDGLLENEQARRELFAFSKQEGVTELWLQLLYRFSPEVDFAHPPEPGDMTQTRCLIENVEGFRQFLREAHAEGIAVHALDGYPEYALKEFHHAPLAVVDAVIAFNQESGSDERFDGVHFDNEPYLVTGWQDPVKRETILHDFLELNAECQKRVREQSAMQYGVDIPFWWEKKDPETGRYQGEVTYDDRTTAASFFLVEMLDNLGIMNYRDKAGGADGMIAHGQELLEYAEKVGGAGIYMGIETFTYEPTEVWFAVGLPRERFKEAVEGRAKALGRLSRMNGQRLRAFDDGLNVHLGVEVPAGASAERNEVIRGVLAEVAKQLGAGSDPRSAGKRRELLKDAEFAVVADVEWDGFAVRGIEEPKTGKRYPGFVATSIMLSKITFADNSLEELAEETGAAEEFFGKYRRYRGLAIHHYDTYRAMVGLKKKACCE